MDPVIGAIIVSILGIASGITSGVWAARVAAKAAKKKDDSDASNTITDAALKLVKPLEEAIAKLEGKVAKLEKVNNRYARRVVYLMNGIETLVAQLVDAGQVPKWQPDEWNPSEDES